MTWKRPCSSSITGPTTVPLRRGTGRRSDVGDLNIEVEPGFALPGLGNLLEGDSHTARRVVDIDPVEAAGDGVVASTFPNVG